LVVDRQAWRRLSALLSCLSLIPVRLIYSCGEVLVDNLSSGFFIFSSSNDLSLGFLNFGVAEARSALALCGLCEVVELWKVGEV